MDTEFYYLVDTYKNDIAHNNTNSDKEKYSDYFEEYCGDYFRRDDFVD
jgi:hypothetical protein